MGLMGSTCEEFGTLQGLWHEKRVFLRFGANLELLGATCHFGSKVGPTYDLGGVQT